MMGKYRKKPIVIDAFQMTPARRISFMEWPGWLARAKAVKSDCVGLDTHILVQTPEGAMVVDDFDWIIKGVQGELYPCKPDIFEQTYEAV